MRNAEKYTAEAFGDALGGKKTVTEAFVDALSGEKPVTEAFGDALNGEKPVTEAFGTRYVKGFNAPKPSVTPFSAENMPPKPSVMREIT